MLSSFSNLFRSKTLDEVLHETKTVRVCGIKFKIKKIDPFDYLEGYKVMLQSYAENEGKKPVSNGKIDEKKVRDHVKHTLICGVAEPKLALKAEDGYLVDQLFVNMKIVNKLYTEIVEFTYGKKKIPAIPNF
jgi:hypothetical protein